MVGLELNLKGGKDHKRLALPYICTNKGLFRKEFSLIKYNQNKSILLIISIYSSLDYNEW